MDSSLQTTKNWLAKIGKAFFWGGGGKKSLSRIKILAHAVDAFLYHCLQKVSARELHLFLRVSSYPQHKKVYQLIR